MTKKQRSLVSLCFMLTIPFLDLIYAYLNNPSRGAFTLVTNLDRSIPFLSVFIIPYSLLQVFMGLTLCYLCFADLKTYFTTMISLNISLLACYLIYFFFPTTVPRPLLVGGGLLTQMVRLTYHLDAPFNCFPSIHCLISFLMVKAAKISQATGRWCKLIINIVALLIILSTMFVKQHTVLDVIGALVLGNLVFETVNQLNRESVILFAEKYFSFLTAIPFSLSPRKSR